MWGWCGRNAPTTPHHLLVKSLQSAQVLGVDHRKSGIGYAWEGICHLAQLWKILYPDPRRMATHSSTLACKISWAEEPGRLQSMGSLSRPWLSDFTFTFHFHALEKEMATHSSVLAWRIPGTEEPSGLLSMGPHRVRHDWSDLAAATATPIPHKHKSFPRCETRFSWWG